MRVSFYFRIIARVKLRLSRFSRSRIIIVKERKRENFYLISPPRISSKDRGNLSRAQPTIKD